MCVCIYIHTNTNSGMLLGHKKECNFAICNNIDGPGKYYAK